MCTAGTGESCTYVSLTNTYNILVGWEVCNVSYKIFIYTYIYTYSGEIGKRIYVYTCINGY